MVTATMKLRDACFLEENYDQPRPHKKGKGKPKNAQTTTQLFISHASKLMLKILQARLQQYVNRELQMFKLVLEKAEEPEIKLPTSAGSS